jgi:hypothetical protein
MPTQFLPPDGTNPGEHFNATVTIPNGQSESGAVDLNRLSLVALLMPAGWTAAGLSFLGSPDGVTYGQLRTASGPVSVAAPAAGEYVVLDPSSVFGARYLKVKSGTLAAPVAQAADRSVILVGRVM